MLVIASLEQPCRYHIGRRTDLGPWTPGVDQARKFTTPADLLLFAEEFGLTEGSYLAVSIPRERIDQAEDEAHAAWKARTA